MGKITRLEEIDVDLRYIERVRAMQPSPSVIEKLDRQEKTLRNERKSLLDRTPVKGSHNGDLRSRVESAKPRIGFQAN